MPSSTPSTKTPADPAAAIPAYGSAPPPSVAATLKSISEFTIVEPTEASTDAHAAAGTAAYEPPSITPGTGLAPDDSGISTQDTAGVDREASEPAFEADTLFDSSVHRETSGEPFERVEPEANDDVIATAFGGNAALLSESPETAESRDEEPTFIGGDPSTRFAAESLEEIARGIRAGEILLPPIDPAAEQSAVLAAVLAAILAPRR